MAAAQVSDSMALAIAASLDYPELPSYGTYVIYDNRRFLLAMRNGKYVAFDISVFSTDGTLITDATDVYLTALKEGFRESVTDIGVLTVSVAGIALTGLALYLILKR